jgi:hypothetical protein
MDEKLPGQLSSAARRLLSQDPKKRRIDMVKTVWTTAIGVAALMSAISLGAQSPKAQATKKVTLVGCVEMEKDYRARKSEGKGGVLGTGVGKAGDYILTGVSAAPGAKDPAEVSGDVRLSGKIDSTFEREVGRQVEVVGTVEEKKQTSKEDVGDLPKFTVEVWHTSKDFCPATK